MKNLNFIILSLILVLALFLRVFYLDKVPVSLFGDEIDVGYQAYSILHTGKDLNGRFLPLYIKSLSEFRAPLYIYSVVPFVGIFGLNEWGVRLPAVFWGMISILAIYLLSKKLFNSRVGLFVALSMAISPWHLQYSRASFEVTMLTGFLIFGVYFFIRGLRESYFFYLSLILFGLTVYIYSTAVVFTPLLILVLLIAFFKKIIPQRSKIILGVLILFITLLPNIWFVYKGEAKERFSLVSIFQQSILLDKINLATKGQNFYSPEGESRSNNPALERVFHNKPTVYAQVFITNYMRSFSPDFLFSFGDINFRHSIHEMGELYYFEIFLLLIGIWALFYREELSKRLILLGWLIGAPIPAALTADGGYHATRLILMLPPLMIIVGLGWNTLISFLHKFFAKALLMVVVILLIFNVSFYMHRYYLHYPVESWRWWHLGYKEAMLYMKDNENNYSKLVFNNTYEPSMIRFLFWWKYPPQKFQDQYDPKKLEQGDILNGFKGNSIDNRYYFGMVTDKGGVIDFVDPSMMYLVAARDEVAGDWDWSKTPPEKIKVLKTIYDPLGLPLFFVVTGKK